MDTIAKRLKASRLEKEWSQEVLAKKSGVSQGTIGNIESGARRAHGSLPRIAEALGIRHNWLRDGDGEQHDFPALITSNHTAQEPAAKYEVQPSNVESIATKKQVPLISWVRAGGWGEIDDHNPNTTETVPANYSQPGRYAFALSVDGDSMTTNVGLSFPHGTIIIVDPDRQPKVGDFVVAKDVATQMATFKRLSYDGGRWYLRPQNKEYPTLEIDHPEKRVIGVVIEFSIGAKLC